MPRYSYREAADYLGIAESTIRAWFVGMPYGKAAGKRFFEPILEPAQSNLVSFYDIASAHVLLALKAKGLQPNDIREVVHELRLEFPTTTYPFLGRDFAMFGKDVVLRKAGALLNLTKSRQLGLQAVMSRFLDRIEFDADLMPLRFCPLYSQSDRGRGYIVIDPDFASGRPVIRGTGIPAEIIAKRNESGESVARLAKDYRISPRAVKEAVKHFSEREAA